MSDALESVHLLGKSAIQTWRDLDLDEVELKTGLKFTVSVGKLIGWRSTAGWQQMILADVGPLGPGFSGSPLLEIKHQALVGIVLQRGAGELARGIPAEFIASRLGLSCAEMSPYPDLIDRRFLLEQKRKEGSRITAEAFYTADPPAQWWGVKNGLVATKAILICRGMTSSETPYTI